MNNLTKAELECLHNAIALQLRDIPMSETNAIRRSELVGKLQFMIENYCKHESDGFCYYKTGIKCTDFLVYACSDSPCFLKCKKCEELFR